MKKTVSKYILAQKYMQYASDLHTFDVNLFFLLAGLMLCQDC